MAATAPDIDALLAGLAPCYDWQPQEFIPLIIAGQPAGWLHQRWTALTADSGLWQRQADGWHLAVGATAPPDVVSSFLAEYITFARTQGVPLPHHGELFPVRLSWSHPVLAVVDRGAVTFLGIRAYGVHLLGLRSDGSQWLGRRALSKSNAPGLLDTMVAGGQPEGLTLRQNLCKEAWEEAGVAAPLVTRARPTGRVTYCRTRGPGCQREVSFIYELLMPDGVTPLNQDGEVSDFLPLTPGEILDRIASGGSIMEDTRPVLLDWALRHGWLDPDMPGYETLCRTLAVSDV